MLASLSVDVDSLDILFPDRCDFQAERFDATMARFYDFFMSYEIKATFFFVGRTAEHPAGRKWIRRLHRNGHEIANHSENHLQGLRYRPLETQKAEILNCRHRLEDIIGAPVVGFRAPGWNVDDRMIDLLKQTNHQYDSSIYPTLAAPALKAYYSFTKCEKRGDNTTLGSAKYALAPRQPHSYRGIVELPITVTPTLRLPFSATFCLLFGPRYFNSGLSALVRRKSPFLNFNLHYIELLDAESISGRGQYVPPTLKKSLDEKLAIYHEWHRTILKFYESAPLRKVAAAEEHQYDSSTETLPQTV